MSEVPESVKYHGGYDPSDPPQGEHWCSNCENWDDDCTCSDEPDVRVQNEGSIFILWPLTETATAWLEANVASAQRWGADGFVVEHRYVGDIIQGMKESGLEVSRS